MMPFLPVFVRGATIEDLLSHDGQGQDRPDAGSRRLAPKRDHGGTHVEGASLSRGKAGGGFHRPSGYRQRPQPCMAPGSDDRDDGLGIMGPLAALHPALQL